MYQRTMGKRILLTGATGGIGSAIAALLCERGAHVVASGRDTHRLDQLAASLQEMGAPGELIALPFDLSETAGLQGFAAEAVKLLGGSLDVLINNAGVGYHSRVDTVDAHELQDTFKVNVFAPILLVGACLPALRASGCGHIISVSSILGVKPMRYTSTYTASKHALNGFAECLRIEAAPEVRVTLVEPGAVETAFLRNTHDEHVKQVFAGRRLERLPPNVIAEAIGAAIETDAAVCPEVIRIAPTAQVLG